MEVLFVGDCPSKHNNSADVAFVGSKSGKTLDVWANFLGVNYHAVNSDDMDKLLVSLRYAERINQPVIILGNKAESRVDKLCKNHGLVLYKYKLPHPSGLNRKLNNKEWLKDQLNSVAHQLIHLTYSLNCGINNEDEN